MSHRLKESADLTPRKPKRVLWHDGREGRGPADISLTGNAVICATVATGSGGPTERILSKTVLTQGGFSEARVGLRGSAGSGHPQAAGARPEWAEPEVREEGTASCRRGPVRGPQALLRRARSPAPTREGQKAASAPASDKATSGAAPGRPGKTGTAARRGDGHLVSYLDACAARRAEGGPRLPAPGETRRERSQLPARQWERRALTAGPPEKSSPSSSRFPKDKEGPAMLRDSSHPASLPATGVYEGLLCGGYPEAGGQRR
uniref:Uncharacterized protein n=1 Tax=Rangifer tarandus platyrhynchus TaxID=3082113 RepID=A0ACB0F406_RANTA|nr:unnamed protein product [Rangifer tarandus platyrhynchus]